MTSISPNVCVGCKNFIMTVFGGDSFCRAFPDGEGIPDDIWGGKNDHSEPVEGDRGIQFEVADGAEQFIELFKKGRSNVFES